MTEQDETYSNALASGWLTREHGSADPNRQNEIAGEIALLLTIGLRAL